MKRSTLAVLTLALCSLAAACTQGEAPKAAAATPGAQKPAQAPVRPMGPPAPASPKAEPARTYTPVPVAQVLMSQTPAVAQKVNRATVLHLVEANGCDQLRMKLSFEAGMFIVPVGPNKCGVSSATVLRERGVAKVQVPLVDKLGRALTFVLPDGAVESYEIRG